MSAPELDAAFGRIFEADQPLINSPSIIGTCELCGLIDHHLDEGSCADCKKKYNLGEQK